MNENLFLLVVDLGGLCGILALAAWLADTLEQRQCPRWLRKIFDFLGN